MATVREITVDWSVLNGAGGTTVLNFLGTIPVEDQRSAIGDALTSIRPSLHVNTTWTVATEGREFDDVTGTLTGAWVDAGAFSLSGTAAGSAVSNPSQILVRLNSGVISDGRFIKGRVFIPGGIASESNTGQVPATQVANISAAFQDLADTAGLGVWRRPRAANPGATPPVSARAGVLVAVTEASVWEEYAVLRQRR